MFLQRIETSGHGSRDWFWNLPSLRGCAEECICCTTQHFRIGLVAVLLLWTVMYCSRVRFYMRLVIGDETSCITSLSFLLRATRQAVRGAEVLINENFNIYPVIQTILLIICLIFISFCWGVEILSSLNFYWIIISTPTQRSALLSALSTSNYVHDTSSPQHPTFLFRHL